MHASYSIGQKWGGGLYAGLLRFRVTTFTDRRMPRGRAISALSLAVWWTKLEKNDKVRHIMIQMASALAVATVFIGLWTPISTICSRRRGGAYTRDKNTYAGTWAKNGGGGRNCGILRYYLHVWPYVKSSNSKNQISYIILDHTCILYSNKHVCVYI
jgi:hypothetical protein